MRAESIDHKLSSLSPSSSLDHSGCCGDGVVSLIARIAAAFSSTIDADGGTGGSSSRRRQQRRQQAATINHLACSTNDEKTPQSSSSASAGIARCFLMGVEASGKSTLVKQIQKLCHTDPRRYQQCDQDWRPVRTYTDDVRQAWRVAVHRNVAEIICTLIERTNQHGVPYNDDRLTSYARRVTQALRGEDDGRSVYARAVNIDPETAEMIDALWNDENSPLPYTMLQYSQELPLADSAHYFMASAKLKQISAEDYLPTPDDIIRARNPTSGATEYNFILHNVRFCIHDMGGQQVERTRLPMYLSTWLNHGRAQDRNYLLYMTSMSDYNQINTRQPGSTVLEESASLLKLLLDLSELAGCGIILFLNKRDLLQRKLEQYGDFYERFSRYLPLKSKTERALKLRNKDDVYPRPSPPPIPLKNAEQAIASYFCDVVADTAQHSATLYCHSTCAVDTSQMEAIFGAVRTDVIKTLNNDKHVIFP